MRSSELRIAIAVHGRFHAFDLTRELLRQGHDVTLLTNYPKSVVARFGIEARHVRNCLWHGILSRLAGRVGAVVKRQVGEAFFHRSFSRWAGGVIRDQKFDVIHAFSGVSEEMFEVRTKAIKTIERCSAHIDVQAELLEEEERRAGVPIDKPSPWMRSRERREYQKADVVLVLSTFARNSFVARGFPASKLDLWPLGSELSRFRGTPDVVEGRVQRITSGQKLRVLNVGTFSFRKGALDFVEVAKRVGDRFEFKYVCSLASECAGLLPAATAVATIRARVPQFSLPAEYQWGDLFFFPTIEDGYPVVLAQAQAGGLPLLATPRCSAPDLVKEGITGWIVSAGDVDTFCERLVWADEHRESFAEMARETARSFQVRDWSAVARDFVELHERRLEQREQSRN